MKTSKQDRIQEYQYLEWQSGNGRLLHREDILRHIDLRLELFGANSASNESKTSEKN